jgi:hypothetical protein
MIDRSHYSQIENEIRHQMSLVIAVLQPYARGSGGFVDWDDVRTALRTAAHALERAKLAAGHKLPPTR